MKLFGTDGIRGRANEFPITPEVALRTGKATYVLNTFGVAWATQRGEMTGGPGESPSQPRPVLLERFLELTRTLQPEFVNWAFLHDLPSSSVDGMVVQRSHLGLGLRRYDGSPKPVWRAFEALYRLPGPASSAERRAP